jgi:hypothetical protein
MATPQSLPIACDLGALQPAERARRADLAARLVSGARAIEELTDGYALHMDATRELTRAGLEWFELESRCCPFLELELALAPGGKSLALRLRGGPRVKEFLASALGAPSRPERTSCC